MTEDTDVRVGEAALIEGIDQDGRASGSVASDYQTAGLLQIRLEPRKKGDQRGGIEDAFALEPVDTDWERGQLAVEHAKGAGFELAENGAGGGLDPDRAGVELVEGGRGQRRVDRDVEGFVLAGG